MDDKISFYEMAKSRRSVRTFDGKGLEQSVLDNLHEYAKTIENPFSIPVEFLFLNAKEHKLSSPVIVGEEYYISAKVKMQENAEAAYGYSFEALLMKAHEMGLGTVWIGGTMPREKFENASNLQDGEVMPCVSPIGVTASKMGIKEVLMRKGVKADTRLDFEKLFFDGSFDKPLNKQGAMERGLVNSLEAVRIAPSAVNKQPWRVVIKGNTAHFYEKKDKGFDSGDYDLQKIDVGIALYNFEQQMLCEGRKPVFEQKDPGISHAQDIEYIASYRW